MNCDPRLYSCFPRAFSKLHQSKTVLFESIISENNFKNEVKMVTSSGKLCIYYPEQQKKAIS